MASLARWFDERIDLAGVKRTLLDRAVPRRLTWWHALGSATLTVFVVQAVTGAVLATFYAPSPDHAYDSIRFVQRDVASGALLRAIHSWGASFMVVLVLAHMVRVFGMGAYKYPREANWVLGVVLFLIVLGFGFTGYLLPWDQRAYWATQVGTSIAGTAPGVGGLLSPLLRGGAQLGAATLTRFYALHVVWFPLLLGLLVLLHLWIVVRQGIAPRSSALEGDAAPPRTTDPAYPAYYHDAYAAEKRTGARFWPDVIAKDLVVSCAVVVLLVVFALAFGATLEAPADPTDASYVPRPEWYFLPLFQMLKLFPGSLESVAALGVPLLLVAVLIALPFFDTRSRRNLRRRPLALASLAVLLGGSALLTGAAFRATPPRTAAEVGRPLTSAERAGRALFTRQCAGCHVVQGLSDPKREKNENEGPELTEVGLHHSAGWLHSYVENPTRFIGDTASMPAFGPPVLSHQEIEEVALYLASLHGPPGSNLKVDIQDTFPEPKRPEEAPAAKSPKQ